MKRWFLSQQKGQTLVILALTLTVLMLMAGLAVDVGMAYNDRRDMQNAADAAALAGARLLCRAQSLADIQTASEAIGKQNGAITVTTTLASSDSVNSVAETDAETFFFRIVGIDSVPVSAAATAQCSCAGALGGAWPIAFDIDQWDRTSCLKDGNVYKVENGALVPDTTGSPHIIVWADDNVNPNLPFDPEGGGLDICDYCNCPLAFGDSITSVTAWGGTPLDNGNRGWVNLSTPDDMEDECSGVQNCTGTDNLMAWMTCGYPWLIPNTGVCLGTKTGVTDAALQAGSLSKITDPGVLLFDPDGACTSPSEGFCGGSQILTVVGTGCVRIQSMYCAGNACVNPPKSYAPLTLRPLGATTGTCEIPYYDKQGKLRSESINNVKAMLATKLCECPVNQSGQTGGAHSNTCVPAVSLVE